MLEGQIETSYTKADNKCVVTTDSMKNTVNVFAKTSPHVLTPELFALHLALHYVNHHDHINKAFIDVLSHKWSRIPVQGKPHGWAFTRDGEEKAVIAVVADATEGKQNVKATVKSGMKDLLVLKTAGSSFEDFYKDEFTTLGEVADRLFSTSVTLDYTVPLPSSIPLTIDSITEIGKKLDFPRIFRTAKEVTLEVFATDESASVQATMYNTAQKLLRDAKEIEKVSYSYPNKHYIPVNLAPFGLDNGLGREGGAEVFHPAADPSGLITASVTRKGAGGSLPKSNL